MQPASLPPINATRIGELAEAVLKRAPYEAFELLEPETDAVVVAVLTAENPAIADEILWDAPHASG